MRPVTLFVYGSLLLPAVLRSVLGRPARLQGAHLGGYRRRSLRGLGFPGLVASRGDTTAGAVLQVCIRDLRRLDRFEDDYYERRPVRVELEGGDRRRAQVYLLAPRHRRLLGRREWSPGRLAFRHSDR